MLIPSPRQTLLARIESLALTVWSLALALLALHFVVGPGHSSEQRPEPTLRDHEELRAETMRPLDPPEVSLERPYLTRFAEGPKHESPSTSERPTPSERITLAGSSSPRHRETLLRTASR